MSSQTTTIETRAAPAGIAATAAPDKRLPNSVLGVIIFVVCEIMFFAATDERAYHRASAR